MWIYVRVKDIERKDGTSGDTKINAMVKMDKLVPTWHNEGYAYA